MALLTLPLSPPIFSPPPTKPKPNSIIIRAQNQSDSDTSPAPNPPSSSSPPPPPLGFGSSPSAPSNGGTKKQKGKERRRGEIIRREPLARPSFSLGNDGGGGKVKGGLDSSGGGNENAFLLAWLGLGAVIIVEGIALAASGFLPEEWDGYFVNYLYPSFTPTVFLFVAGTVVYGVTKYLQNEKPNGSK